MKKVIELTKNNIMSEVVVSIPEGKCAKWVNNVLTLVDEPKAITECIKTFEDACNELGEKHPFVIQYKEIYDNFLEEGGDGVKDIVAYLKLRIIGAALNEGWEPKFTKDEKRYSAYFNLYTKEEYDNLDDEEKSHFFYNGYSTSSAWVDVGSRLVFKTKELAAYAGKQFIKEYEDYLLGNPNTSNKP